ncbi:DNA-binding MarR family transcriptional regulator [Clostridiales Family XIII bacterium PM5-7]
MDKQIANQKMSQFYSVWRDMNIVYEEWAKKYNLSYNSLLVLLSLWNNDAGCTQTAICEEWILPKQTVNSILKGFQGKGYVVFTSSKTDKRSKGIRLTTAGRSFAKKPIADLVQLEASTISAMGNEAADALIDNMALFVALFKEKEEARNA